MRVKGADGDVYALGDCTFSHYAPTAQVASQQGAWLAKRFNARGELFPEYAETVQSAMEIAERKLAEKPFKYIHAGSLAYIGTDEAIADLPFGVAVKGFATFLFWRSVYLTNLFSLKNRLIVAFDWFKTRILDGTFLASKASELGSF